MLALLLLTAPGSARAADDPTPMFRAKEEKVRGILKDETIEITKKKTMVVGEISRVFDYMELAHRALSRHWDKLTGTQRTEFVGTLKRLIELSVLGKIKPAGDYEVDVDPAAVQGSEALLPASVSRAAMTDPVDFQLKLFRSEKGWVVYDMVIDDVSLLSNYKTQFNKIISEQSFPALLKQMKDRLADQIKTGS